MAKHKANLYMAAVLIQYAKLCGFTYGDRRVSPKTRRLYSAIVRCRYRQKRKLSKAFRRWHRSICADAQAAGLVPYRA